MNMICDNPRCQYHRPKHGPDPRFENVWGPVLPNGEQQILTVERHLYIARTGLEFHLCGTCNSAVAFVTRGAA